MLTNKFPVANPTPQSVTGPSQELVSEVDGYRIAVRQAEWRMRQAERRLAGARARLEALACDDPGRAAARAEIHLCERAVFNRRLELREACAAARGHLPAQKGVGPGGLAHRPAVVLVGQ